jgi:hypothetical protein
MLLCVLGVTDAGGQDGFLTGWTALCDVLDLWIGTEPRRRPFSDRLGIDAVAGGRCGAAVKNLLHRSSLGRS